MFKNFGNGLNLKKEGPVCHIETNGSRLYLGPTSSNGFKTVGIGIYFMKLGGLYDCRGLILGPNSPFKNIPIPGMILKDSFRKKYYILLKKWKLMKLMVIMDIDIVLKNLCNTGKVNGRDR